MKTLLSLLTLGTITLFSPAQATARDCNDGRSRYENSGYNRNYSQSQRYTRGDSHHHQSRYNDRHHSYAPPSRDWHGHRVDSHGHRVDSHGHHRR